jgi:hypothetical protein
MSDVVRKKKKPEPEANYGPQGQLVHYNHGERLEIMSHQNEDARRRVTPSSQSPQSPSIEQKFEQAANRKRHGQDRAHVGSQKQRRHEEFSPIDRNRSTRQNSSGNDEESDDDDNHNDADNDADDDDDEEEEAIDRRTFNDNEYYYDNNYGKMPSIDQNRSTRQFPRISDDDDAFRAEDAGYGDQAGRIQYNRSGTTATLPYHSDTSFPPRRHGSPSNYSEQSASLEETHPMSASAHLPAEREVPRHNGARKASKSNKGSLPNFLDNTGNGPRLIAALLRQAKMSRNSWEGSIAYGKRQKWFTRITQQLFSVEGIFAE